MRNSDGPSKPLWRDFSEMPHGDTLNGRIHADVLVIGAGISGMTTAWLLMKEGKKVVVVDSREVSEAQTERSTAQLSNASDDRYIELEKLHGLQGIRLIAESLTAAIDEVERIVREERIDCDFERVDGYLFMPSPDDSADYLDEELAAAHRAGLTEVEKVLRAPMDFNTGPALRFPRQAQFDPVRYVSSLVRAFEREGGLFYGGVHVTGVSSENGTVLAQLQGQSGGIIAEAAVVATNSPVNDRFVMHTKQSPWRTYVTGLRVPSGAVPHAQFWDTGDPYHYVRLQSLPDKGDGAWDVILTGGEDHKTGQENDADDRYARLEAWTRRRFPQAEEMVYQWSGQVMEPVDGLGFLGRNPLDEPNIYIITGDSGQGTSHGTIGGMIIRDLILDRPNPWQSLYDPGRKTMRAQSLKEFIADQVNVAVQYKDYLTGGETASEDGIPRGEGRILRRGLAKLAVYRDEAGTCHECSAVCPHLGCIVHWNSGEKSWDCPCHGSRFNAYGAVLEGPAVDDLEPAEHSVRTRPAEPDPGA